MNDDQYQQKLQHYYTNAGLQSSSAPAVELVTHPTDKCLHELLVRQVEIIENKNEEPWVMCSLILNG